MQANRLDGCPETLFLTLLICFSENDFEGGDVSRDISYAPEKKWLSIF